MSAFTYIDNHLYCEKVNLKKIAQAIGTPFYVYSYTSIIENFKRIKKTFSAISPLIAFSVKSNSNRAILRSLAREGAGFDVVSGGELQRVLQAGGSPQKIIFAGVGKTPDEVELAVKKNILMFNVESLPEAYLIEEIGRLYGRKQNVALRINPDVDPDTHRYITTGKKENKFGIPWEESEEVAQEVASLEHLALVGLHSHIGSQITSPEAHILAMERLRILAKKLKSSGIELKYINIGGGFSIQYVEKEKPYKLEKLAARIIPLVKELGCRLIMEPGRYIVGPAGALVTRVLFIKNAVEKNFVIVDSAMTDLLRPALYGAYHRIVPVVRRNSSRRLIENADVVGPVCESADFLGQNRRFRGINPGDLLCVLDTGAYGFVMTSQYNSRPRSPEVLVRGTRWFIIRERERIKDITRLEQVPDFLI
ncbi:diaminopimelate decarboxylase [Candidatus Sumerlaeota bacterium]|nr:diaminopimelate decarboxylase [Candidatus Sumerlaeota bacterium]